MKTPEIENPVSASLLTSSEESMVPENALIEAAPSESSTDASQEDLDLPPARMEGGGEGSPEQAIENNNFPDWLNPLTFPENKLPAESAPQVLVEPLAASITDSSGVPETPASTEIIHEELVESLKTGESLETSGNDVPDFLKSTVLEQAPNSDYIEPLEPAEIQSAGDEAPNNLQELVSHPTVEEEDLPTWPPSHVSEEPPIIQNVESGSGLTDIPGNVPEPELSIKGKMHAEENAFPDWLRKIGAGSTGESTTNSAISDTQPISRDQSIPEPQPIEKSVSLETESLEPIESPEILQGDLGEYIQPSQETKASDIEEESVGLLVGFSDQQVMKPEKEPTFAQEIPIEEPIIITQPFGQLEEKTISPVQEPLRSAEGILPPESPDLSVVSPAGLTEQPVIEVSPATEELPYSEPTDNPEVQPISEEKATMVWLENLSVDHGTEHGEIYESPEKSPALPQELSQAGLDEQPVQPELVEEPHLPDSVSGENAENIYLSEDNPSPEKMEGKQEPGPDWSYDATNGESPAQLPEDAIKTFPEMSSDEKTSVISPMANNLGLGDEPGNKILETAGTEGPTESIELPDWLKELEKPSKPIESTKADDDFIAWLQNPPAQDLESESTSEVEAPAWLDENTPIAEQTVPTNPEEWVPVDLKPAANPESSSTQELITEDERTQVFEREMTEEIPAAIEQTQPVESAQTVGTPQVVVPVEPEETPVIPEKTQVVESEQIVETPQVVEPLAPEEIPAYSKQTQVGEAEQIVEVSQDVEPGTSQEIPAFLEQKPLAEIEQTLETFKVVEPAASEEIPAFLEQTRIIAPEQNADSPLVTGPVAPEEIPAVPEQTQISGPKLMIDIPISSEATTAVEPVTIPPVEQLQPSSVKLAGIQSPVPPEDKDLILLANAQSILDKKYLDEAMKLYSRIIQKGRLLPDVIHDLQEASSLFPMNMKVWQTLGDAYMRANRLQDALDAYTKAEELLR